MAQKIYAFKGVTAEGNRLIVRGPWVSMDREEAIDRHCPICDTEFGKRLDAWYWVAPDSDKRMAEGLGRALPAVNNTKKKVN